MKLKKGWAAAKKAGKFFHLSRGESIALLLFFLVFFCIHLYGFLAGEDEKRDPSLFQKELEKVKVKVDINNAPWHELYLLPGVGDSIARKIIQHRKRNRGFKTMEELLEIKGIGRKTLENLRPHIYIGGMKNERGT